MSSRRREPPAGWFPTNPEAWIIGLALGLLEVAWLGWFLIEPLPNVQNVGGQVRRWELLSRALPSVVPGVTYSQSHLGLAMRELSHVENLPQRLPILLSAGLIAGAALALGQIALRGLGLRARLAVCERIPLAFGLGTAGLGVLALVAGRLGLLAVCRPWGTRGFLVLLLVTELVWGSIDRARARAGRSAEVPVAPDPRPKHPLPRQRTWAIAAMLAIVGPFLALMALAAMLPTIDFDALTYHLQGPKEYFQAGQIRFLPHNVYTSMPFNVEMLHLLGMEVIGDWWAGALAGQVVLALFAPAAAALIALTALRWASPRAAWFAAVIYLTTPWVYRLGVLPYVEGPLCFFHAALIWAASRAWDAESGLRARLWGAAGALAGAAMACKYPALLTAVEPFGLLALFEAGRRIAQPVRKPDRAEPRLARGIGAIPRSAWPIPLAFAAGWSVVAGPWLVKNVIDTGNPVYPLAYGVFGGRHWNAALDAKWQRAHGSAVSGHKPVTLAALWDGLVDVAGRSDWQSPLFTALAPLAFLRKGSRRFATVLFGYVLYLFATWWLFTHRLDRFWLPLLPPLAILAGLGADWARGWAWSALLATIMTFAIATNLVYVSTALAALNQWTEDLGTLRLDVPKLLNKPLARLDADLPPTAKILLVGQAGVFHIRHDIVYNTVFNPETIETVASSRLPEQVRSALVNRGITHVYVDWAEIERYRGPGNYGFTPFVTPELFVSLVQAGVLEPLPKKGERQDLYQVVRLTVRATE